jgi:putative endonuclease
MKNKTNHSRGLWAEFLCRLLLRLKLYRIVASRYPSPLGEIDIIAKRGKALVFVEVKARGDAELASGAITARQRERLERGMRDFLARHPRFNGCDIRFDAMWVVPGKWPRHIEAI